MGISKFACEEKMFSLMRVCMDSLPHCSLGNTFDQIIFEAALMVWFMGKSVFRFCQSFTSFADTVQKLRTLLNKYYLV